MNEKEIKWFPIWGEGWSEAELREQVFQMGGPHYEQNVRNAILTKSATSIIFYNLRDLKAFCNIKILGKSIVIYISKFAFFFL